MKRLLKSSKYWAAITGSAVGLLAWHLTKDVTVTVTIIGLFGVGIGGTAIEDAMSRTGGELPPDDDEHKPQGEI